MKRLPALLALLLACGCSSSRPDSAGAVTPALGQTQTSVAPMSEKPGFTGAVDSLKQTRVMPVVGTRGMVVSDDRVASEWGAEILRQGGNAIDAAVATAFALSVTRPHYASLGGGGFLVYCPKPGKTGPSPCYTVDYREEAPHEARRDMYVENLQVRSDLSRNGPLASGVPGVTAGLMMALEKWGTQPRKKLLSRPIQLARQGIAMTGNMELAATERWGAMNDEAKRIFGCKGKPCEPGSLIRQPELARVLEKISANGAKGFYQGEVAQKIVEGFRQGAGIITAEDLASYRPKLRNPVHVDYQGNEIISMPPPSAGGTMIAQLFGYMQRAEKSGALEAGYGSVQAIHAITHAMALSFADRAKYFGDADHVDVPVEALLSPAYLDSRWSSFDAAAAALPGDAGELLREGTHTTHFSVIDRQGNAVAITTTINDNFGSGFVPPGTGVVMNNEMDDFAIRPGVPNLFGLVGAEANAIAPGKRPLSSMAPTIVRDAVGNTRIVIGAAGGPRITTSVFLSILNRLRFGMSLPEAVAAGRFHQQWKPDALMVERMAFAPEALSRLRQLGYTVQEVPSSGKVHSLERFPNGRVWGMPDIRGEGAAVAE